MADQQPNHAHRLNAGSWIDIRVTIDEPGEVALLRHFLVLNRFEIRETHNRLSLLVEDIDHLVACVQAWAFDPRHPTDPRTGESLDATLRGLGHRVLEAAGVQRSWNQAFELASQPSADPSNEPDVLDLR